MSFLAELRRRKVFQVAIGYLAVAWLLVQVTATILPAFDLPVWALRLIILLFALGFPIAVLMAWALELTPEGVKLDVSTSGRNRMLVIAAALMAVAVGWFFLAECPRRSTQDPPRKLRRRARHPRDRTWWSIRSRCCHWSMPATTRSSSSFPTAFPKT